MSGIRKIVKENAALKKHMYRLQRWYYWLAQLPFCLLKVNCGQVLFNNFQGKGFAGNPRAVAEELHRQAPSYKILWITEEKADASLPDYVSPVRIDTPAYFKALTTSGTWVFNIPPARGIKKRHNQVFIQTFHGDRPLKKVHYQNVGKEETDRKYAVHDEICDYGVVGSRAGEQLFREGLGYSGPLIEEGCPRNDCLVNPDQQRIGRIRESLGIAPDERILLYAPTFRYGRSELACGLDFDKVLDALEKKTLKPWRCLYRAHLHTKKITLGNSGSSRFMDVSGYTDMADLLLVADMLITDYSSSAGDFCLTEHPSVLYLDPDDPYNRSLVFDPFASPHWIACNQEEMIERIEKMTPDAIRENNKSLREFYGIHESGHAARAVVSHILRRR